MYSTDYSQQSRRVSSRLVKTESKKMMRQTMLFGGGALLLIVLFIVVILPGFVRLMSGGETGDLNTADSIPPQVPVIAAPVSATFSATLAVNGFGEPKSQVVVLMNGQEAQKLVVSDQGEFNAEVMLTDGENALSLYSLDEAGNESAQTPTYKVVLDSTAPTITLETPTDGQQFELRKNQTITVKGKTEPRARVLVNGRLTTADGEGVFTSSLTLVEGENALAIEVTDQAGNTARQELKVSFSL